METEDLIQTLRPALAGPLFEALNQRLEERIAYLIHHDFERLVRLLYTIDVDERNLKHLLQQQQNEPASLIITELIIKRQLQKWASRQQASNDAAATDEERW
jgi:hypothetical protein